ncbi:uncharacterized protein LOC111173370 isoform X2 [Delphinapterus leucas]|uniref:Uncharacterized protein LOC111173370 isoform X2 n=1 Tax=Delphinapterus leucas TaxID=9749 RepID=A0A2Y9MVZ7_DELLE|nr:uncharacterized protein LOC111173370 isoform X2 [Delphinapterus leucas]
MTVRQLVVILVQNVLVLCHLEAISVPFFFFFVSACSAVVILVGILGEAAAAATKLKRLESFIPFLPLVYLKFSPAQKLIYVLTLVGEEIRPLTFVANAELTFWKVWILSSQARAAHQPLRDSQLWRSSNAEKNAHFEKSTPCLLIGAFRPLTFKVINAKTRCILAPPLPPERLSPGLKTLTCSFWVVCFPSVSGFGDLKGTWSRLLLCLSPAGTGQQRPLVPSCLLDYWNKNEDVPSLELKALMSHLLPDSTGFLRQLGNLWEWWSLPATLLTWSSFKERHQKTDTWTHKGGSLNSHEGCGYTQTGGLSFPLKLNAL